MLNDSELVVWSERSQMVIGGGVTQGQFVMTTRRLSFVTEEDRTSIFFNRKPTDLWELDIWNVLDMELLEMKGFDLPLIRIRYKEGERFFTFPSLAPRPTLGGVIVLLNYARLMDKNVALTRSIGKALRDGELDVGERIPKIVVDQPMKADEVCHQCAKEMLVQDTDRLSGEVRECIMCDLE